MIGNAQIQALAVTNFGTLVPGGTGTAGFLGFNAPLTEASSSTLDIDINGTTAVSAYDQVQVTGFASLGGTLNISPPGYTPSTSDTFKILDLPGGRTGTFPSVADPTFLIGGFTYTLHSAQ